MPCMSYNSVICGVQFREGDKGHDARATKWGGGGGGKNKAKSDLKIKAASTQTIQCNLPLKEGRLKEKKWGKFKQKKK